MPGWNLVISLLSNEEGQARKKHYERWAEEHNVSVSEVVRELMDKRTGFKWPKEQSNG